MYISEESDSGTVPMNQSNKDEKLLAEIEDVYKRQVHVHPAAIILAGHGHRIGEQRRTSSEGGT